MTERLSDTSKDLGSRLQHWKSGLGLLKSMQDKLLGIGLGRLPSNYAARVPAGEFGGEVRWHIEQKSVSPPSSYVTLSGPKTRENMGGSLELTQRVHPARADLHRVKLTVRVQNDTPMELYLCERHLLYDHTCQSAHITLMPEFIGRVAVWQHLQVDLEGLPLSRETGLAPRLMMFSLGILNAGSRADISQVGLFESDGASLLSNGDFLIGPARWFPAVQSHFEPWHLDNLYLEVLVERGILGLLSLLMPLAYVMWRLVFGCARRESLSAYVVASLLGVLLVGLVSSVMDVPRVAFIFFMLTLVGSTGRCCGPKTGQSRGEQRRIVRSAFQPGC